MKPYWVSKNSRFALAILAFCGWYALQAQAGTEVYLASIIQRDSSWQLGNPRNISQNPGYDNQPAFLADGRLLYSRTRNGQTDLVSYDPDSKRTTWLTDTPGGSEYSPLPVPGTHSRIAAIRLDTTGLQRLYAYEQGQSNPILADLKVGYQVWPAPDLLVCTVLEADRMDLIVARPPAQEVSLHQRDVGRSLSRIPNSPRISYVSKEKGETRLKSLDPVSGATDLIATLPEGVEDICWLPDGSLLCGGTNELRRYVPGSTEGWIPFRRFEDEIGSITRLAVDPEAGLLALVAEKKPSE